VGVRVAVVVAVFVGVLVAVLVKQLMGRVTGFESRIEVLLAPMAAWLMAEAQEPDTVVAIE
jgi:hypothetical protein